MREAAQAGRQAGGRGRPGRQARPTHQAVNARHELKGLALQPSQAQPASQPAWVGTRMRSGGGGSTSNANKAQAGAGSTGKAPCTLGASQDSRFGAVPAWR